MDYAAYNPKELPVEQLPVIYGFNNGGSPGFYSACLIAADGTFLGSHLCSHEGFMYGDLGIVEGSRPDRHETFRAHYPDGYRMDFVGYEAVRTHAGLQAAFALRSFRRRGVPPHRLAAPPDVATMRSHSQATPGCPQPSRRRSDQRPC